MCPPGVCQRKRFHRGLVTTILGIISHSRRGCYCTRYGRWKRKHEMIRNGDWYEGQCDKRCLVNYRMWGRQTHDHEIKTGNDNSNKAKKQTSFYRPPEVESAGELPAYDNEAHADNNRDEKPPVYEST
ncbi:hypothetical protein GQ53DRAFT_740631 [Thozetella sp. PMI_491]|nr:hypothetical protein GQ53DRAFT_740631 [Thozetella sp. PMI_491]